MMNTILYRLDHSHRKRTLIYFIPIANSLPLMNRAESLGKAYESG